MIGTQINADFQDSNKNKIFFGDYLRKSLFFKRRKRNPLSLAEAQSPQRGVAETKSD